MPAEDIDPDALRARVARLAELSRGLSRESHSVRAKCRLLTRAETDAYLGALAQAAAGADAAAEELRDALARMGVQGVADREPAQ